MVHRCAQFISEHTLPPLGSRTTSDNEPTGKKEYKNAQSLRRITLICQPCPERTIFGTSASEWRKTQRLLIARNLLQSQRFPATSRTRLSHEVAQKKKKKITAPARFLKSQQSNQHIYVTKPWLTRQESGGKNKRTPNTGCKLYGLTHR